MFFSSFNTAGAVFPWQLMGSGKSANVVVQESSGAPPAAVLDEMMAEEHAGTYSSTAQKTKPFRGLSSKNFKHDSYL